MQPADADGNTLRANQDGSVCSILGASADEMPE